MNEVFTTAVPLCEPEFLGSGEKEDLLAGASFGCCNCLGQ